MKTVLAVICLAVYCAAQTPEPCQSPQQWEGRMLIIRSDRTKQEVSFARISYDEINKRERIIDIVEQNTTKEYYDILRLHDFQREYRLNLNTRQCNVTTLTRPFRRLGVPRFAKFVFQAKVGAAFASGESLIAQTWNGEFEDKSKFVISVTSPDCAPLNSGYYSESTGFEHSNFFDVSLGISDPMVFIPPRECSSEMMYHK